MSVFLKVSSPPLLDADLLPLVGLLLSYLPFHFIPPVSTHTQVSLASTHLCLICQAPSHFSFFPCQMPGIDGRHLGSPPSRLVFSLLTSPSNSCPSSSPLHTPSHGCLGVTQNSGHLPGIPFLLSPRHPVILLSQMSYAGAIFVCSFFSLHSFCYQIQLPFLEISLGSLSSSLPLQAFGPSLHCVYGSPSLCIWFTTVAPDWPPYLALFSDLLPLTHFFKY